MPQFVDMTPTWGDILPYWKAIVEANISCKRGQREQHNANMGRFWQQMAAMARAADAWNEYCQSREIATGAAEQDDAKRINTLADSMDEEASAYAEAVLHSQGMDNA